MFLSSNLQKEPENGPNSRAISQSGGHALKPPSDMRIDAVTIRLICVGTRGSGPTVNGVIARGSASYEARSTQRQDRIGIGMGDLVQ